MVNKKGEIYIFFLRFSNYNFSKKKRMNKGIEKGEKEGKTHFVFNYRIPSHESNNPTYILPFVSYRKNNDMILIVINKY